MYFIVVAAVAFLYAGDPIFSNADPNSGNAIVQGIAMGLICASGITRRGRSSWRRIAGQLRGKASQAETLP